MPRPPLTLAQRRARDARRRARYGTTTQRGYGGSYQKARLKCLERDGYVCQLRLQGCTIVATTADHITPTSRGGGHELTNLRAACLHCNASRGNGVAVPTQRRTSRSW